MSHLHQLQVGFIVWQSDHGASFPWQVSATNGGTMEPNEDGNVFPHFRAMAEFKMSPTLFVCPTDKSRKTARSVTNVTNENISYFLNLDAGMNLPCRLFLSVTAICR